LTLGQLRQAGPAFTRIGIDTPEGMGAQTTVIYLAMHAADPKVTAADVDGIVGVTFPELKKAVEVVARLMGVEMKEITPGEAPPAPLANKTSPGEPAASPTSTGSTSMAA
jgi:cobalamin biosynthesis protein CbiG